MLTETIQNFQDTPKNKEESRKRIRQIIEKILPDMSRTLQAEEVDEDGFDASFILKNLGEKELALKDIPVSSKHSHRPPNKIRNSTKDNKKDTASNAEEKQKTKVKAMELLMEGCKLNAEAEAIHEIKIGTEKTRSYVVDITGNPTCTCPHFLGKRNVKKICKHISATLLMIGVKNETQDEALLTKYSYTKADRKKIDNLIGRFDQSEKECEQVLKEFKTTLLPKKKPAQICELPPINLKTVIARYDSYNEAMKDIKENQELKPKWYAVVAPDGRHRCPGSNHTERLQVEKGSVALVSDFYIVRKSFYNYEVKRERRFFCCNMECISSYSTKSLTRFSNLNFPEKIEGKYLDKKTVDTIKKKYLQT